MNDDARLFNDRVWNRPPTLSPAQALDRGGVAGIGHNNPPGPIEWARETIKELGKWMVDHPTIQTDEDARQAHLLVDRARGAVDAVEAERVAKVGPLNETVTVINAEYKAMHNSDGKKSGKWGLLDLAFNGLKARLAAYLQAEEDKRIAIALEAQRIERAALDAAREAEAREREAIENAQAGEFVDVVAATQAADVAFKAFEHANKAAAVAVIDTRVKVGGGFTKPIGLRNAPKVLVLVDPAAAIAEIGPTVNIVDAILASARAFRKLRGRLPKGVNEVDGGRVL